MILLENDSLQNADGGGLFVDITRTATNTTTMISSTAKSIVSAAVEDGANQLRTDLKGDSYSNLLSVGRKGSMI